MKITIVNTVTVFALTVICVLNVKAAAPVPYPTPPVTPAVIKANAGSPAKTLTFYCPDKISVAPIAVPAGWQSLGTVSRHRQKMDIDTKNRMVVCWYGMAGDTNLFASILIGQTFPADYECKIPNPGAYIAVCNKKIRITR